MITSVVSNWSYFEHLNYLEFLTTSSHLQKQKTINFSTQIKNYFLTSFSWAVVTFVVPNLSHSDYFNLPVTVDNKLLATKKKGQSYFAYLAQNMKLRTYLSFPLVVVASLALILWHSDYQWLLTTNKRHSVSPENGEVLKLSLEKGLKCHSNRSNQLFVSWKEAFSQEFYHTSALKYKVR